MPLALDIETEGLMHQRPLPSITCVCLYDGSKEYRLVFYKVAPAVFDENKKSLLALLDASDRLIGFNAVLFDLEYIRRFFDVPQTQLSAWVEKTIDPFMCMKLHLGMTCTLKAMLALNGLPSKSASGLQAIRWAKEVYFPLLLLLLASCFRLLLSACCFRLLLSAFAFGFCFWLLLTAIAFGCCFRLWLSALAFGCCLRLLLSALAFGCCSQLLLSALGDRRAEWIWSSTTA